MSRLELATVTLDTNVFPAAGLVVRAHKLGIAAAVITVSRRETEGSPLEEEVAALESIAESGVWGESRRGRQCTVQRRMARIAHMIWLVGTKRIVGVHETQIPAVVSNYLAMTSPDHSDVYGDFESCPLERDLPGHMRSACVAGATRLVVQDRERTRPPFRLLSTWPENKN